jgi:hypothetical protein
MAQIKFNMAKDLAANFENNTAKIAFKKLHYRRDMSEKGLKIRCVLCNDEGNALSTPKIN